MSDHAETPFAKPLPQMDCSCVRGVGSGRPLGSTVWKVEIVQKVFGSCCALAEPVNLINVCLGRYVMFGDDDLERHERVYVDDNAVLLLDNAMTANDPLEFPSLALSFTIVCDLRPLKRAPILDNEAFVFIKREAEMAVADALVGHNDVTSRTRSKDDSAASSWDVAEPQLKTRQVRVRRCVGLL